MKHFLSLFLLFSVPWAGCIAQKSTAREIVEKSLQAHTAGQPLKTYVMRLEYDTLGKVSTQLYQRDPMRLLIDSMMATAPDSVKKVMQQQMITGEADFLNSMDEMYRGERRVMISDKHRRLGVLLRIRPNRKGTLDSTRNLNSGLRGTMFRENPIELIQLMRLDSTELHYTGRARTNSRDCYLIQIKLGDKWLDTYIDQQNYRLLRVSAEQVDEDPLMGKGPLRYRNMIDYLGYRSVKGFLLPSSVEEITTDVDFTTKWKVVWENINLPLSEDLFKPQLSVHSRSKFRSKEIGRSLWVLEQLDANLNGRFLVQTNEMKKLNVFGELSNNNDFNRSVLNELEKQFPGYEIDGLFNVQNQFGIKPLDGFFAKKAHLYAPKGVGYFAEEKGFLNRAEDSTWNNLRSKGRISSFDKEFRTPNVTAIILNPNLGDDFTQYFVSYYLPIEKVIYYHGNPYSAKDNIKNAIPREKVLYDLIKSRKLAVEKIVYSGALQDNAPLFMPFDEFEKRIQNTDFTIYKKTPK